MFWLKFSETGITPCVCSGAITTLVGGGDYALRDGLTIPNALFTNAQRVVLDSAGNLFVATSQSIRYIANSNGMWMYFRYCSTVHVLFIVFE